MIQTINMRKELNLMEEIMSPYVFLIKKDGSINCSCFIQRWLLHRFYGTKYQHNMMFLSKSLKRTNKRADEDILWPKNIMI